MRIWHMTAGLTVVAFGMVIWAGTAGAQASDRYGPEYADADGSTHEESLRRLQGAGILADLECGEAAICPNDPILRADMAIWLVRAREYVLLSGLHPNRAAWSPYPENNDVGSERHPDSWKMEADRFLSGRFDDKDKTDHYAFAYYNLIWRYVGRAYSEGLTAGCGPRRFCPEEPVTRGQMATFLVRAFDVEPGEAADFADTHGKVHSGNIDALAASGITSGCSTDPLLYCPDDPVTRGQMATFLVRAMSLWMNADADAYDGTTGAGRVSDDLVDCEDFPTRADAQVFYDRYSKRYGDVAGLVDLGGIACEDIAGVWTIRKDVDLLTDEVSYWVHTAGITSAGDPWIGGPYFGVSCWSQFVNLRQEFVGEEIEVRYRAYPAKDIITEPWQVSEEGRNTFLYPHGESALVDFLLGSDAGELRMEVDYGSYRFPVTGFASAYGWLQHICWE